MKPALRLFQFLSYSIILSFSVLNYVPKKILPAQEPIKSYTLLSIGFTFHQSLLRRQSQNNKLNLRYNYGSDLSCGRMKVR